MLGAIVEPPGVTRAERASYRGGPPNGRCPHGARVADSAIRRVDRRRTVEGGGPMMRESSPVRVVSRRAMERFDFVVIGTGAAGESAAFAALERGRSVAVVERELVGGSCSFWACIPSKALLHAASEHRRGDYSWARASDRRDYMINREGRDWPDDSRHIRALEAAGARVFPERLRIAGRGIVEVRAGLRSAGEAVGKLEAATIILATGSQPKVPPIDGLAEAHPWTNREATLTRELPRSVVVLGGGAMGVELSSVFARFGVETALVHSHERLIERDHRRISDAAARILRDEGVGLRLGVRTVRVRPRAGGRGAHVVELSDGGTVRGERIVLALGRSFGLDGLGLEIARRRPGLEFGRTGAFGSPTGCT